MNLYDVLKQQHDTALRILRMPDDGQPDSSEVNKDVKTQMKRDYDEACDRLQKLRENPLLREEQFVLEEMESDTSGFRTYGFWTSDRNAVYINPSHLVDDDPQAWEAFIHEAGHRDFGETGKIDLPMSLQQCVQINRVDEIASNIKSILYWRTEYCAARTDEERESVLKKLENTHHIVYAQAIRSGEINPLSNDPEDFRREMQFIGEKTTSMWMENCSDLYRNQNRNNVLSYMNRHNYDELLPNDENYQIAKQTALTIGGFDFSEYVDDRVIEVNFSEILDADKALQRGVNRSHIMESLSFSYDLPSNAHLSPEQYAIFNNCRILMHEFGEAYAQEIENARDNPSKLKKIFKTFLKNVSNEDLENVLKDSLVSFKLRYSLQPLHEMDEHEFQTLLSDYCSVNGVDISGEILKAYADMHERVGFENSEEYNAYDINEHLETDEQRQTVAEEQARYDQGRNIGIFSLPQFHQKGNTFYRENPHKLIRDDPYFVDIARSTLYDVEGPVIYRDLMSYRFVDLRAPLLAQELQEREQIQNLKNRLYKDSERSSKRFAERQVHDVSDQESQSSWVSLNPHRNKDSERSSERFAERQVHDVSDQESQSSWVSLNPHRIFGNRER